MKRYKIDLSATEFFALIKNGSIGEDTEFEAYDVPTVTAPKAATKKVVRKPRRTKAQIEADEAKTLLADAKSEKAKRAFPWKDEAMNEPSQIPEEA